MRAAAWRRKQLLVMGMGMGLGMGCTLISDMWRSSSSSNATCNMARDQGTCPAHPWLIGCRAKPFNWTIYGNDSPSRHIISSTWVRGVDFWYFVKWVFFCRLSKFGAQRMYIILSTTKMLAIAWLTRLGFFYSHEILILV